MSAIDVVGGIDPLLRHARDVEAQIVTRRASRNSGAVGSVPLTLTTWRVQDSSDPARAATPEVAHAARPGWHG